MCGFLIEKKEREEVLFFSILTPWTTVDGLKGNFGRFQRKTKRN